MDTRFIPKLGFGGQVGANETVSVNGTSADRRFGRAVARAGEMRRVFEVLQRLARTDVGITLAGETGCGKDLLASAIHETSPRANGPFVVFDCSAIAPTLMESELFGHERGSFAGAVSSRQGTFERAQGGTLFLDEVGELPIDLQPRLRRALEHRQVQRIGAGDARVIDVRIIAATNRDLEAEVDAGRFRRDLYFRLSAAVVRVPALRERPGDIPLLVRSILDEIGCPLDVPTSTLDVLERHAWPGNVRELMNVLSSAIAFVDGPSLEPHHLLFLRSGPATPDEGVNRLELGERSLEELEREAIKHTLAKTGGNKARAARTLGIAVSTFYEKLKKHGL